MKKREFIIQNIILYIRQLITTISYKIEEMAFLLEDNNKKYILKKKIGKGATCECFIGNKMDEESSDIFAVKIFPQNFHEFYSNEVKILTKIKGHNNIITLYEFGKGTLTPISNNDSTYSDNYNKQIIYYQVLEYAENGELKDYVNGTHSRIFENISAKLFVKLVNAIKYLHENNIAHCDIKPENVLIGKNFIPKINDFGFSQEFNGENGDYIIHQKSGTPNYSSPDVRFAFTKGYDGRKNDIFSLGVLLFVITIGDFPFHSTTYSDEKYKFIIKGRYNKFWEFFDYIDISDEFKDLINSLISLNPAKRLSINEILKHPWIIKNLGKDYNEQNEINDKEISDEFNSRKNKI